MDHELPPAPGVAADGRRAGALLSGLAVAASLLAAAVGLWLWFCASPTATNRLRDDAYYEFVWAANVATGRGPMVSDGVTTSGVQWLWSLLLVPFAACFGAQALPVVAPWLGFVLHVATAASWVRAARSRLAGLCLAACWLGHPLLLRESQNGQETALACFCATWLWLVRRADERVFVSWSVLAVFARSDLWFLVAALSVWRHRGRLRIAWIAPVAVLAMLLGANLAVSGSVWQDSALPMAWLWHRNHELAHPDGAGFWRAVWWYARPALLGGPFALASAMGIGFAVFTLLRPFWPVALRALPALAVGCAAAVGLRDLATAGWAALLLALLPAAGRRRVVWSQVALFGGLAAIVVLHWAVRWYPRDYYVAPLAIVAFAAVARHSRCRLLLAVFAGAQVADWQRVRPEPLTGQVEMQMAGTFLREVLPASERVGCFNSGLVTFLADTTADPARAIRFVNLDGVVDARSFAALRRGELAAYLDAQGIRFVLDNPVQFARDPALPHACGQHFGGAFDPARDLVEIARFDAPGIDNGRAGGDSMRLYWRCGAGAEPARAARSRDLGLGADGARYIAWVAASGQTLQCEEPDGTRETIVTAEVATTIVVRLDDEPRRPCRLFVAGVAEPVLQLPGL